MTLPENPAGIAAHESSTVTADTPCRKCGYNLRGLSVDGKCPECSSLVRLSVSGDLLRYSDPQYVQTLARGVGVILWGILITFVLAFIVGFVAGMMPSPLTRGFVGLVTIAGSVVGIVGAWLLTTADPSGIGEERYGTARKIIRIAVIAGAANQFINFVMSISPGLPPAASMALATLTFLVGILSVVGQFAQLNYLHKLALRIPDMELSQRAKFLMWAFGTSLAVVMIAGFIGAVVIGLSRGAAPGAMGGAAIGVGCFAGIVGLALLVFGVMYLFMLSRFRNQFLAQAAFARQAWATAQTPI